MKIEQISITSHLGSWDPISEAQNWQLFHPGKGGKQAKTKQTKTN